jgi:hypothetical protein
MSIPGFTAEASVYDSHMRYRLTTTVRSYGSGFGVKPQLEGCTACTLYTEPGGGRTAGIKVCCTKICKFGFGCVQSCWGETCWTPSGGDIAV